MVRLIAQNITIFDGDGKDAFARTGSIGCYEVKAAGATGIIVGHSEAGDAPKSVNAKLKSAIANLLQDNVLLVGEHWNELGSEWQEASEKQKENAAEAVEARLLQMVEGIAETDFEKLVFGYEPSWGTRGSGKAGVAPPQPEQISLFTKLIREILAEKFGEKKARIVYGGSLTPERAVEIMKVKECDGFILGSACKTVELTRKIAGAVEAGGKPGRKPVLVLNWKAYRLQEPYSDFIEALKLKRLDAFVAPNFVDLRLVKGLL